MSSPSLRLRAPLLWLLVPCAGGLALAKQFPFPPEGAGLWLATGLASALTTLGMACRHGRGWAAAIILTTTLAGFLYLHAREPYLHEIPDEPPREVTAVLEIVQLFPAAPQARSSTGLARFAPETADERLRGRRVAFSIFRRSGTAPERTGRYTVQGVVETVPDDGDGFNAYLANSGVHLRLSRARMLAAVSPPGWLPRFCTTAGARLRAILSRGLEDPSRRSLYLAMLLGEKAVLSPAQENAFMRSGTFHIFSISGLHVTAIATALALVLKLARVPRRAALLVTIPGLWLYVQITGGSSPAMRSFIMLAFLLGARVFRLPSNMLASLVLGALVTLLLEPLQLFSTGFQMSYAVVAALIVMGVPLTEAAQAHWKPFSLLPAGNWQWQHKMMDKSGRWLIGALAGGWTAFLASAPAGIGYFSVLSPGSLLANLIIIPLSGVILYTGFASLVFGLAGLTPVSGWLNAAAGQLIGLMDRLLQRGVELPGMFFPAEFRAGWLAPASLALMTATMFFGASTGWSRRYGGYWLPAAVLAVLVILGVKFQ